MEPVRQTILALEGRQLVPLQERSVPFPVGRALSAAEYQGVPQPANQEKSEDSFLETALGR